LAISKWNLSQIWQTFRQRVSKEFAQKAGKWEKHLVNS
jgi:hypothetical protein